MRKILTTIFFVIFSLALNAQDAQTILENAAKAYNNAGGIKASFVLNSKHSSSNDTYSYNGTAFLKANKFKIEIPDAITWFDGRTQWVYMKENEEVNISNPDNSELQNISPSYILNTYKNGYKLTYKGEKVSGNKTLVEIELTPFKQNSDIRKIIIGIDKSTNIFSSIIITDKSGMTNNLKITNLTTGVNLSEEIFKFNKANYPNAEIIDLR